MYEVWNGFLSPSIWTNDDTGISGSITDRHFDIFIGIYYVNNYILYAVQVDRLQTVLLSVQFSIKL
jgi:hypothetical protein